MALYTGKAKYMEIRWHRCLLANEHIRIGSNSYEKVKLFKYLFYLLTNQNFNQEETKCRLKARNSCYFSIQTLLSSRLLSKNSKIEIYTTKIMPVVLYPTGMARPLGCVWERWPPDKGVCCEYIE